VFRLGERRSTAFLVAGLLGGVLSYFASAASQQIAKPVGVDRLGTFLIGNEHFEASDGRAAVFCKTEDRRRCTAAMIVITESRSTQETLTNGQLVPMLTYMSRPGDRLYILVKGLDIREGEISNVLAQRQRIADEPVSLTLAAETYPFRLDELNLTIEERGKISPEQTLHLLIDDNGCIQSGRPMRRHVEMEWMGDLDGDQRADFFLNASDASAYGSCVRGVLPEDPEQFLILSSKGGKGEVGMVVPMVGHHP
jgi:hypothetical protein